MKRALNICYILAMIIGIGVGVWHFFVPYLFEWYSYIPTIPDILRVSIDWVNFFFSLILTGYSILLLIVRKKFFQKDKTVSLFYYFFIVVWIARVFITVFHNWGFNMAVIGYIIAFSIELILIVIPMIFRKKLNIADEH